VGDLAAATRVAVEAQKGGVLPEKEENDVRRSLVLLAAVLMLWAATVPAASSLSWTTLESSTKYCGSSDHVHSKITSTGAHKHKIGSQVFNRWRWGQTLFLGSTYAESSPPLQSASWVAQSDAPWAWSPSQTYPYC